MSSWKRSALAVIRGAVFIAPLASSGCFSDEAPEKPQYTSGGVSDGQGDGAGRGAEAALAGAGQSGALGNDDTAAQAPNDGSGGGASSDGAPNGPGGAPDEPGSSESDGADPDQDSMTEDGAGGSVSGGEAGGAGADEPGSGGARGVDQGTRGPMPATDEANFPFPQNRESSHCTYPTSYDNADVVAAFEKWKADTVTSDGAGGHLRVKRLDTDPGLEIGSTVSEGIAYGMLIAVYMNDQELFDGLFRYEQQWLTERGLMHWYINAAGTEVLGGGAASDADEDMAWALLMADRQWGGSGSLDNSYYDIAVDLIDKIWQHEILDGKLLKPGDQWGDWNTVNISYFAPSYYRTFAEVTGNDGWNQVTLTSYDTLENTLNEANGNIENGLVPAWSTSEGAPNGGAWAGGDAPTHHQYDSCRTPFRFGLDYCFHEEPRALDYVGRINQFHAGIGVADMVDGYDLDGTPRPQFQGGQSAAFIGPAGVGAMAEAQHQGFVDDAYDALSGLDLLVGGAYYDESWTVLALLTMTGNFIDYRQHEPVTED